MRQYTTKEQTQHLIELGFPKPNIFAMEGCLPEDIAKDYASGKDEFDCTAYYDNYSIGELISFLVNPKIEDLAEIYRVEYDGADKQFLEKELIDALYLACVDIKFKKYKEE